MFLELVGNSPASFDFQASSKPEAEAIFNKIQESKQKARISHVVTPTASIPPVRDSVVSASTHHTAQESPTMSAAEPVYEEPVYEEEEQQYIEPEPEPVVCEGRWATAMYDFQAEGEEEISIKENDEIWVMDYVSSDEWWRVQLGDLVGIVPATYVRVRWPFLLYTLACQARGMLSMRITERISK